TRRRARSRSAARSAGTRAIPPPERTPVRRAAASRVSRFAGMLLAVLAPIAVTRAATPDARPETAEPAGAPLTLAEAERLAEAASPALRAADAQVREAQGRAAQVRRYPNPDLVLDSTRFTDGSGPR